jgi:quercetin dioxygenase-like cupin family protein
MNQNAAADNPAPTHTAPPELLVPDLAEALDFFTRRCGFRVEMIVPADAPKAAIIHGQGITLRLKTREAPDAPDEPGAGEFVIRRLDETNAWSAGRAGMQYRDLIPGRLGGRVVASHIRIPGGGQTPDYVHYHKVRFQMIYCKAGWVRVVYEDQGPPFVLEAGDLVLQPPEIRHRVLESSAGLEVIEIGCPAVHETWADHEMELPTRALRPDRLFGGHRFVRHRAREARWATGRLDGFEARDTGVAAATNGLASARVVKSTRRVAATDRAEHVLFLFVLRGEMEIHSRPPGLAPLRAGDSCVIPAGMDFTMSADDGLEWLEVSLPDLR